MRKTLSIGIQDAGTPILLQGEELTVKEIEDTIRLLEVYKELKLRRG